jgi:RNA polymerase sigma factor (TIGR02999 family)
MTDHPRSITELLVDLQAGRQGALEELLPLVYEELRHMAARLIAAEQRDHTLQPTALVHEAYLRLVDQRSARYESRIHFYAVTATLMRRVLVDYARRRMAEKRGGGQLVALDSGIDTPVEPAHDIIHVDHALEKLAQVDARQARVVELRYFAGLSTVETAEVLGISERTVKREWAMARAWLQRELSNS